MSVTIDGGIDWSAVAGFANAIVTLGLLVAAVLAWRAAQAQILAMEQARKESLLPVVSINHAASAAERIRVVITNVGPGPALSVRIRAWAAPFSYDGAERSIKEGSGSYELDLLRQRLKVAEQADATFSAPIEIGALGSNESRDLEIARRSTDGDRWAGGGGLLAWETQCVDAYNQSQTRRGEILIEPPSSQIF